MKKVVRQYDLESKVSIEDINDKSIVGIVWRGGQRSFVIESGPGSFCAMDSHHFSLNHSWKKPSKKEYVDSAMNQNPEGVYIFDTYKELYEWLIK